MKIRLIESLRKKRRKLREVRWALCDAIEARAHSDQIVFIDLGSNLGQGFNFFQKFYSSLKTKFILFEPNPNCRSDLNAVVRAYAAKWGKQRIEYRMEAASTFEGRTQFYGLDPNQGGSKSQGGSIVAEHNSSFYDAKSGSTIDIECIDFAVFLRGIERRANTKIIVKMDIEGAEYDLLQHLINANAASLIDVLYVEFHSVYRRRSERQSLEMMEVQIIAGLEALGVKVRLWH